MRWTRVREGSKPKDVDEGEAAARRVDRATVSASPVIVGAGTTSTYGVYTKRPAPR